MNSIGLGIDDCNAIDGPRRPIPERPADETARELICLARIRAINHRALQLRCSAANLVGQRNGGLTDSRAQTSKLKGS